MKFLLRTLSRSYLIRHAGKSAIAVLGIAAGVTTFVSVGAAQRSLVSGFRSTIDRLAGKTQVQITALGGVPETLLETVRDLPDVGFVSPVIEQVVQPEGAALGSLLVVGVDLVGDSALREYAFSGQDADVDDPLVFLAQADSVALSRNFAGRAGLRIGDRLTVHVGGTSRQLTVRALLEPAGFARAFGGNIAVTDVYAAQTLFGRGRRFDRLDLSLQPSAVLDDGIASISRTVGSAFRVETPARRGAQVERLVSGFIAGFRILGVVALGIGLFIIFNVFSVAVQRRRRDIGILRALGATPRQVGLMFLAEAAVLGIAGGVVGILAGAQIAGWFLSGLSTTVAAAYGLTQAEPPEVTTALMIQALAVSLLASLLGAWIPAREAARVPASSALASGVFTVRSPTPPWQTPFGLTLLVAAFCISRFQLIPGQLMPIVVSALSAVGTTLIAGPAARLLIRPLTPLLARLAPVAGRVATDSLLRHGRRTSGTAAVLIVSMSFVLGVAGYLQAIHHALARWTGDNVTADLIVRASVGLGPSAVRLPYDVRTTLLAVPGVTSADGYRNERTTYRGQDVALVAFDAEAFARRTRHQFISGDEASFTQGLTSRLGCVVSENFARKFQQRMGDNVTLDSPTGPVTLTIAAIVVNFISESGTVIVDRQLFADRWQSDRVDSFHLTVAPGADPAVVRDAVRVRLAPVAPAIVSTRAEFFEEIDDALGALLMLIRAVVMMALVVALMAVLTSLWVSVIERTRDIGVLKALGAVRRQISLAVLLEALTLATVSLMVAVPLGTLLAWFLRVNVSGGFRFPAAFPSDTLLFALVALPGVAILAAWMPARWAASLNIAEAISYE